MKSVDPAPAPLPDPAVSDPFADLAEREANERRRLRRSLVAAAVVHAALLVVTFPKVYSAEIEPPKKPRVYVLEAVKFKPPEPAPPTPPPQAPIRTVPVPDPDPDHDPIPVETPPPPMPTFEVDLDALALPSAPPEPEPTGILVAGEGGVSQPVRLNYVAPRYTELARRARIEGTVILQAVIRSDGSVDDVRILKSLPLGLTEEAVSAVLQWRYEPAVYRGKPVDAYFNLSVIFRLQ